MAASHHLRPQNHSLPTFIQTCNHNLLRTSTHATPTHLALMPRRPRGTTTRKTTRRAIASSLELTPSQQAALAGAGLLSAPVVAYSEYVLLTTGCGLPPGPGGSLGAIEGVSYLVVAGIVSLSAYSKLSTGGGLPAGPSKLLGAAEGLAFLLAVAGIAAAVYVAVTYGGLPSAVPGEGSRCFPVAE